MKTETTLPKGYTLNRVEDLGTHFKVILNSPNTVCDFSSWTTIGRGDTKEEAFSDAIRNIA